MERQNKRKDSTAGRWTRAQHEKFMEALEKYGRDWVKVEKKIKTRTLLQIRSHAQKVFLNMSEDDIKAFIGSDDQCFNNNANLEEEVENMQNQDIKSNDHSGHKIKKTPAKKEKKNIPFPNIQQNINPSLQNSQTKLSQQSKLLMQKSNEASEEQSQQGQKYESLFFQMLKQNQEHFLSGGDFLSLI